MYFRTQQQSDSDALGWFVATQIRSVKVPEGHEELTRRTASGLVKDPTDLSMLIAGVRRPDLADPRDHILLGEQSRHFLRTRTQSSFAGWLSALGHIRLLHQRMMAATNRADEFGLMGEILHSIQDGCAPAHVERDQIAGHIVKLRIYDPKIASGEHVYLTDDRDEVFVSKTKGLKPEAVAAITVSREFLKLALNHLSNKKLSFLGKPPALIAKELNDFLFARFWMPLPELRMGSAGEHVLEVQGRLNNWVATSQSTNLPLLSGSGGKFDADTATVLEAFQRQNGLTDYRIVRRPTWEKLLSL